MLCLAFTIPTLIYQTGVSEEQLIWQGERGSLGWSFFFSLLFSLRGQTFKQLVGGIAWGNLVPPLTAAGRESGEDSRACPEMVQPKIPDFV